MEQINLFFIGGGNMAEAIFSQLLAQFPEKTVEPSAAKYSTTRFQITVIDHNPQTRERLTKAYAQLKCQDKLNLKLDSSAILILAVKPHDAQKACNQIQEWCRNCLIISLIAGIDCAQISTWLNNPYLVRAMPNTPAAIAQGITGLYFTPQINSLQQQISQNLFQRLGQIYLAKNENEINQLVALSSSSIAFVYYFIEGMITAAVEKFSFTPQQARSIVCQVIQGSLGMVNAHPELTLPQLRQQVSSKKGTTEYGILALEQHHFQDAISDAICSSYQRALEINKELSIGPDDSRQNPA
jgi:pyrroline-5-carboxylate reductase